MRRARLARRVAGKHAFKTKFGYIDGWWDDDTFVLEAIYVKPQFRGQGHARELMEMLPEDVRIEEVRHFEDEKFEHQQKTPGYRTPFGEDIVDIYKHFGFQPEDPEAPERGMFRE